MIVKIISQKQNYYFEGTQVYKESLKSVEDAKHKGAYVILDDNKSVNQCVITVFETCGDLKLIATNCLVYLMNDVGKTIERLN